MNYWEHCGENFRQLWVPLSHWKLFLPQLRLVVFNSVDDSNFVNSVDPIAPHCVPAIGDI